jgi:hypothetical protein
MFTSKNLNFENKKKNPNQVILNLLKTSYQDEDTNKNPSDLTEKCFLFDLNYPILNTDNFDKIQRFNNLTFEKLKIENYIKESPNHI